MTYNPSLRTIPRDQTADVLPTQKEPSILSWLEGTGRLKPREEVAVVKDETKEEESEEIDDLMGDSDKSFDDELSLEDDD
ncbi:MAG: DUF3134 domain-containing protein [Cyanobacteria bacterium P01_E01_bin.43]